MTPTPSPNAPGGGLTLSGLFRRIAAAFGYRDFRILWLGAFTSSVGTWMQNVAQSWLVLTLTGSAFFLGLDAFLGQFPIMLLTLIGGVVADRHDRRRLLVTSQCVQMASAFALAALVYLGVVRIWHILSLSVLTGCAQAFGGPAYQSLVPTLVEKRHLPNAIALNSIQFHLARVIGPLLAGLALAAFGTVFCFTLNGLSFFAVIVALLSLRVARSAPGTTGALVQELRVGLAYVRHEGRLASYTVLAFTTTFLGASLLTLMPVVVQQVFHQGVADYSRMMVFSGAGSVIGALVVAGLGRVDRMERIAMSVQVLFGATLVAFALSRVMLVSELLLFAGGAASLTVFATISSLIQLIVPNEMRGRVMSIYMVAFRGGMPLGALVAGYVASVSSAPLAIAVNGTLLALIGAWFLTRDRRPSAAGSE